MQSKSVEQNSQCFFTDPKDCPYNKKKHGDVWCGRGIEECVCEFGETKCNDKPAKCSNGERVSYLRTITNIYLVINDILAIISQKEVMIPILKKNNN